MSVYLLHRKWLRLASALTVAAVAAGSLAVPPLANTPAAANAPATDVDALAQARRTGKAVEVGAATTPTDTVTAMPDGTLKLKRSVVPVRKRVDGVWRKLDATLRSNPDGTVGPVLADSGVSFSGGGRGAAVTMSQMGKRLGFTLPLALPKPVLEGPTATYSNVLPGVDLKLTATTQGGFTQVYVVRDADAAANPALRTLTFGVETQGLTVAADAEGAMRATDVNGRAVFAAPAPMMWDSGDRPAKPLGVKVNGGSIELTPDAEMLTAKDAKFPMYLDPPWAPVEPYKKLTPNAHASVAAAGRFSNKWNATFDPDPNILQVSWNNSGWHARSMVNFGLDLNIFGTASIRQATLNIVSPYSGACRDTEMRVFAPAATLSPSNATWDYWYNTADLGAVVDSRSFSGGYSGSCSAAGHAAFNVLAGVTGAVAAGRWTQTFVFTGPANEFSDTANYKELSLADISLEIWYNRTPSNPANLTTSPQTPCTGTVGTVGDGDVLLFAPVSDPDGGTVGVRYEVWKSSVPGTLIKTTDPATFPINSGGTAVLTVDEPLLKAQSGTAVTEFSWRAQIWDGYATSGWSPTCKFKFDPTRPGAPRANAPADGSTRIGQPVTIAVTKPVTGSTPASYLYQLNAGPSAMATADASGNASITITPTRRTNTVTINSVSAGGNISIEGAALTFTTLPLTSNAADGDLTGDGAADLVTVGGSGGLPAGVWLAQGRNNTQVVSNAGNLGIYGNGVVGDNKPANFDGAQIITGVFAETGMQDVLAYYPSTGRGSIITGNGDGSPLLPQFSGNQYTINETILKDENTWPLQVANAGDTIGNLDNAADLIGIGGVPGAYHLNYYFFASVLNMQGVIPLPNLTPAGNLNWNEWRIATAQVGGKTSMFLWHPPTGALHLWRNLTLDLNTGALTFQPFQLRASNWNTGVSLNLRAADINGDGNADLWTVGANRAVTANITGDFQGTTGTITAANTQTLATVTHSWSLSDKPGTANPGDAIGTAADNAPAGTTARPLTGNSGVKWNAGDLFSPDAIFNGTDGRLAAGGPAVATNAEFSVSAWVKPTLPSGTVLSQDGTNVAGFRVYADSATASWQFAMPPSDSTSAVPDVAAAPGNTVRIGVWTQLTASFNPASGMMNLAINGVTVATATHTSVWSANGPFHAGAAKTGVGTYGTYFTGQLANLQTWSEVLDLSGASRTLRGDSRADIIRKSNGTLFAYYNGGITPDNLVKWDNAPGGYTIGTNLGVPDSAIQFADLDANGLKDLIRKQPNGDLEAKYNDGSAKWIDATPWYVIGVGWAAVPDSGVRFTDLNGDGRADIAKKLNGNLEAFYNGGITPTKGVAWDQAGPSGGYIIGTGWTMPDSAVYFTDLTGDHYADIIYKHSDGILGAYYNNGLTPQKGIYWDYDYANGGYNVGWGWTMPDSQVYFADLTGEGYADVIRKNTGRLAVYYNGGINLNKTIAWYGNLEITPDWNAFPDSSLYIG